MRRDIGSSFSKGAGNAKKMIHDFIFFPLRSLRLCGEIFKNKFTLGKAIRRKSSVTIRVIRGANKRFQLPAYLSGIFASKTGKNALIINSLGFGQAGHGLRVLPAGEKPWPPHKGSFEGRDTRCEAI